MALTKLSIQGYSDDAFSTKNGSAFVVMINPASLNHGFSLKYTEDKTIGKTAKLPKFDTVGDETLSMDFILDTTGAVAINTENSGKTVPDMVSALQDVVYKYYGTEHQPNFIEIVWGTFLFKCRLTSLKVDYQMFKPSGEPLRAKISLGFKGYMDVAKESSSANKSSPDLTHIVTIMEGDNLPALCNKIYKDSSHYLKIAEINGLSDVRDLNVGNKLIFPPLN